jgi:nitroimidazol reductase NimA-like FMN-containing flavoprotein (pyridoxamine 5'-phosphate oxidase superfamily)
MSASPAPEPQRVGRRLRELTSAECFDLLADGHLGRLAVVDDRGPVMFPDNYLLDRHTIVLRTEEGTKLRPAAARHADRPANRDGGMSHGHRDH